VELGLPRNDDFNSGSQLGAVADASLMPAITRGNTHAPTLMIAERLASSLVGRTGGVAV